MAGHSFQKTRAVSRVVGLPDLHLVMSTFQLGNDGQGQGEGLFCESVSQSLQSREGARKMTGFDSFDCDDALGVPRCSAVHYANPPSP